MLSAMNTSTHATAVAYYRTSSATNVGQDKDSLKRQQDAVRAYAAAHQLEVVREFYDAAVSGADPVMDRAGFVEMLTYLLGNGARIVLVENASRFARDLASASRISLVCDMTEVKQKPLSCHFRVRYG